MLTGAIRRQRTVRHTIGGVAVTGTMTTFRAAIPFVRALVLAGLAILLILFGLPAVLAYAATATI